MKIYYVKHRALGESAAKAAGGFAGSASGGLASGLGSTFHALARLAALGTRYMIGVPAGLGLATGILASKVTSPGAEDLKLTEKRLEMARIRAMTAENRRRIEAERKRWERNALNGTLD